MLEFSWLSNTWKPKILFYIIYLISWHVKLNQNIWIITATFVRKFLCCSELFVFNTDTQVVTSGECGNISESDQRDLEDFTRFAVISKPNIQITQNKNPVEANYIAYHIIANFFKTDIQLSQKKMLL